MANPLEAFFKGDFSPEYTEEEYKQLGENEAETPDGLGEIFGRGVEVGAAGIGTDFEYFKGLLNVAVGDDEAAADNIANARQREESIAGAFGNLEDFSEFVENPTFGGFATQVAKNVGQVSPYLLSTIGSGLGGVAVTGTAKVGATVATKHVTKRLVKDALEKKLKGAATPEEERILAITYRLAQRNNPAKNLTLKGGAAAGMYGQEYTSMAGSNFGENLDFLDQDEAALRAAGLAIPQAFIGLKGEQMLAKVLMKDLGELAAKRSAKEGSTFSSYAKTFGVNTAKSAATEGTAEVLQEGISVANRFNIDDEYTKQDALMRLGESAFAGFFGGGGIGAAGSAATGSFRAAGDVMGKAKSFIEQARQQQVDGKIDQEQYGIDTMGFSTPEPQSSVNAQIRHALDSGTKRHSVWIEGPNAQYGATETETNKIDIEGETFYTRFIPGRGTILSKNFDISEEVSKSQASDASLAEALQYSAIKPADGDIAVEVLDRGGNVVWQQGTNEAGVDAAIEAAKSQIPEGGNYRRISIKEALENRKKLFEEEQGPRVRNMDEEGFDQDEELDTFGQGARTYNAPQPNQIGDTYKPRDPSVRYDTTGDARNEFGEAFADLDMEELGKNMSDPVSFAPNSPFATMSDAFMRQAAKAMRDSGNSSNVYPQRNNDGSWSLMEINSPEADMYGQDSRFDQLIDPEIEAQIDAEQQSNGAEWSMASGAVVKTPTQKPARSSVVTFVKEAIKVAAASRYARQKKVGKNKWASKTKEELITVDGQAVNLLDLVKEGQRMFSIEEKVNFTEGGNLKAQRNGVLQILSALIEQGQVVRIGGYDIRSKQLKELSDLISRVDQEEKTIAAAALEWDMDAADPQLSGRLDQLLKALSDAELGRTTAETNSPLDRLKRQRKAWGKEYSAYLAAKDAGDTAAKEPEKPPLLALMDVPAGFQGGKIVTLGKLLNTTPVEPTPKDAQYALTNEDGAVVFEGDKQQVQEQIESSDESFTVNRVSAELVGNPKQTETINNNRKRTLTPLTNEEFATERNVGFNERNENIDPDIPTVERGEERPKPIGFSEETSDANPDYTFEPQQNNVGDLKQIGLKEGSLAARVAEIARRTLRLEKPVSVISIKELLNSDNFGEYFGDPKVAAYVKDVAEELRSNPQGGGRYIGFGDAHIILIDPDAGKNELDTAMIVAHELGHALFKEQLTSTLKKPELYNRLFTSFQTARDAKDAPAAYKGKHGFEEWYADQAANWAIAEYAKDRKAGLIGAHFRGLMQKLAAFHKALSAEMKKRFGKDVYTPEFRGYMDEVLKRRKDGDTRSGARNATMQEKILVRKVAEVIEKQQPGFTGAIMRKAQQIVRSDGFTPIYNFIFTADSRLRKIAGNKVADLFYARSQESNGKGRNKLGFIKTAMLEGNTWFNKLEDVIDGKLDSPEVQESLRLAFSSTPTRELNDANAVAVRGWFDSFYDEYIDPSKTNVGRQRDYAPVVLKLSAIDQNPAGLVKLIMEADPEAKEADVTRAVQKLVSYQQAVMDESPIDIKETNPSQSAEKAILLTKKVDREKLQKAGFLEDPDVAIMRYTSNMVKRVEWNRSTKDNDGNSIYEEELRKLDPKARSEAEKIVHKYLGYQDAPLGPMWRAINSWGTVLQVFAILPLAVLGSIPELAGPVIASKEFGAVTVAMKEIVKTVRNREDARSLARDLGIVTSQSVANIMMTQSELDFMDTQARKLTEGFFRVTLLDTYTKFTREFAANMGVRFLENHSNPDSAGAFSTRYLKELGVTAADVQVWSKSNQDFTTPEGKKVREALQRFVESSTLRPNAAERPLWASDPRWALVWQLKGFFYSYGKVMLAGAKREANARLAGASSKDLNTYAAMTGAAGVFALMGIATMPLAMVGMELREYAKFGLAYAIPGIDHESKDYFRTDGMGWSEYLGAAFERSFAAGPVTVASQAMQAADWGGGIQGAAAVVLGPTAETINRIFTDGFGSTFEHRMLPTGLL